ncbi:MAG: DUF447 family protein [Proteobacteria bacterium]|nr:DUF447 family protein [Pseudomonadota bacterium]
MIFEGVITTSNADGAPHITPMGFQREGDEVSISPFVPSTTLVNLKRDGRAVMNLSDDVRIIAGCLTGRRAWPVQRATVIDGWRISDSLAHLELTVSDCQEHAERPRFRCRVVHEANHAAFRGFNRAQAAVLEAAILYSRLEWLAPDKLASEMAYLAIAVGKTAGDRERIAWQWLVDAMAEHPRHRLRLEQRA